MKKLSPRMMMILPMIIFGTLGVFVRNIPIPSAELAFCRAVMAVGLIGLFLIISKTRISLSEMKKELPLLLFSGIAIGINWILLFEAYRYTTVSVATLSYYFAPVLVTIACPFLFREKLTRKQVICFMMSTLGIILITGTVNLMGGTDLIGVAFGLGAAVLYASAVLINKFITTVEGIQRTFLQFLAAIIILLPYVLLTGGFHIGTLHAIGWLNLLIVGLLHTGIAYCMYFAALKEIPGQKAAILSYIDPLVAVMISVVFLNESMTLWQALGGLLVLGFTLWNELGQSEKGTEM